MGFLSKILIISLIITLSGCITPIKLDRYFDEIEKISFYGVMQQNNFFIEEQKTAELKYEWDIRTHGSFSNSAFVAIDSFIIVPDLSGRITVYSSSNGKKKAELKYSGGIKQSPIILKSYMIFIVNEQKERFSTLVVYDLINGKEVRDLKLLGNFAHELVVLDNFIFAISDNGMVYKIANWGNIEWEKDLKTNIYSNPILDEKTLFLANSVGEILSISLDDGELISRTKISKGFESGLNADLFNLYIGDNEGKLYSINKNTFEINWVYESKSKIVQTPGMDLENIYFGNLSGDIISLNKSNGKQNWIYKTEGLINISPLIFSNIIIQPNLFKTIDILEKNSGQLLNQLEFDRRCRTTPLYFNDKLFFGVDKGEVYCYSFAKETMMKGK